MKKINLLLMTLCLTLCVYAQPQGVQGTQRPVLRSEAGRTTEKTMTSRVFGGDRAYSVYLPKSYDTQPDKKYPIFYLLHGASDDNRCFETKAGLSSIVNQLVSSGASTEMIIVTPNAGGSEYEGYYNMDGDKYPYEQFFFDEFMPYIEKTYRVLADKNHRAIGGLSMGGGGSTMYALMHPELFCAVYEMSGALGMGESSPLWNPRNELAAKKKASYLEHVCAEKVDNAGEQEKENYRTLLWYLDCGDDDFTIDFNWDFYKAMKRANIPCELRIRDGGHTWTYWKEGLNIALPLLSVRFAQ